MVTCQSAQISRSPRCEWLISVLGDQFSSRYPSIPPHDHVEELTMPNANPKQDASVFVGVATYPKQDLSILVGVTGPADQPPAASVTNAR